MRILIITEKTSQVRDLRAALARSASCVWASRQLARVGGRRCGGTTVSSSPFVRAHSSMRSSNRRRCAGFPLARARVLRGNAVVIDAVAAAKRIPNWSESRSPSRACARVLLSEMSQPKSLVSCFSGGSRVLNRASLYRGCRIRLSWTSACRQAPQKSTHPSLARSHGATWISAISPTSRHSDPCSALTRARVLRGKCRFAAPQGPDRPRRRDDAVAGPGCGGRGDPQQTPFPAHQTVPTRELGRMIVDALLGASGPMTTSGIVTKVLTAGGHGEEARTALASRVRAISPILRSGKRRARLATERRRGGASSS